MKKIKIGADYIDWDVTDYGVFECFIGDEKIGAGSLDELEKKAREAAKKAKVRVEIPVTYVGGIGDRAIGNAQNLTLTGINDRTKGVTTRDNHGKRADELDRFAGVYRSFTVEEMTEYNQLLAARREANKAYSNFLEPRFIGRAGNLVDDAIKKILKPNDEVETPATSNA